VDQWNPDDPAEGWRRLPNPHSTGQIRQRPKIPIWDRWGWLGNVEAVSYYRNRRRRWRAAESRLPKLRPRVTPIRLPRSGPSGRSAWGRFCKNTTAIGTVTQCRLCMRLQTSISVSLLRAFALALRGEPHSIVEAFCSPVINSRKLIESPLIPPRRRVELQKRSGWQYVVRGGKSAQSTSTVRRIALNFWRRGSESNGRTRICSPLTRQENQCLGEFATLFLGGGADSVTNIS